MSISSAGNTYNPALVILDEKGYSLRVELDHEHSIWCAEKDGHQFSASNPLELLAVASIFERFGDDWQDAIGNPDVLGAVVDAAVLPDDGQDYLAHPYFDESDRNDWHELPLDRHGRPAPDGDCDSLTSVIRRDFDKITSLVRQRLTECSPDAWLAECPHALLNDVSFCPVGDGSARIFVEYLFRPSLTENSHHTDSWWAIVLCPYLNGNPYTESVDYVIEHFGWSVQ